MKYLVLIFLVLLASTQATKQDGYYHDEEEGEIYVYDFQYLAECDGYNEVSYVDGPNDGLEAVLVEYELDIQDDLYLQSSYLEFYLQIYEAEDPEYQYYLEYATFLELSNKDEDDNDYLYVGVYEDEDSGELYFLYEQVCEEQGIDIKIDQLVPDSVSLYDNYFVNFSVDQNSMGDGYLTIQVDGFEIYSEFVFPEDFEGEEYEQASVNDVYPYPDQSVAIATDLNGFVVPEDHWCFDYLFSPTLVQKHHHKKSHHKASNHRAAHHHRKAPHHRRQNKNHLRRVRSSRHPVNRRK